jgi:hypothetical protein
LHRRKLTMNAAEIQEAFDWVFDQAIVFHAYTDYMRDYEIITYAAAAVSTGIAPQYDRYVFRNCVEADVSTTVTPNVWTRSLDDRLIDHQTGKDLDGYVWGVKWHCLYPGGKIVANSERAQRWSELFGIGFHEARIETNAHEISLVFSDLEVTKVEPGYAPYVVDGENHYIPPTPLSP